MAGSTLGPVLFFAGIKDPRRGPGGPDFAPQPRHSRIEPSLDPNLNYLHVNFKLNTQVDCCLYQLQFTISESYPMKNVWLENGLFLLLPHMQRNLQSRWSLRLNITSEPGLLPSLRPSCKSRAPSIFRSRLQ